MKIEQRGVDQETLIPIIRCGWADGSWWEFRTELDWNTSREIRILVGNLSSDNRSEYLVGAQKSQTVRLVGSTVGWSFKLAPGIDSIGRLADWRVREALNALIEAQGSNEGVVTEETKKGFVWPSFLGRVLTRFGLKQPPIPTP